MGNRKKIVYKIVNHLLNFCVTKFNKMRLEIKSRNYMYQKRNEYALNFEICTPPQQHPNFIIKEELFKSGSKDQL